MYIKSKKAHNLVNSSIEQYKSSSAHLTGAMPTYNYSWFLQRPKEDTDCLRISETPQPARVYSSAIFMLFLWLLVIRAAPPR